MRSNAEYDSNPADEIFRSYFLPVRRQQFADRQHKIEAQRDIQAKLEAWHASVPEAMHYQTGDRRHLALVLQMTYKYVVVP